MQGDAFIALVSRWPGRHKERLGGRRGHRQGQLWQLLQARYQGKGKEEAAQGVGAGTVLSRRRSQVEEGRPLAKWGDPACNPSTRAAEADRPQGQGPHEGHRMTLS